MNPSIGYRRLPGALTVIFALWLNGCNPRESATQSSPTISPARNAALTSLPLPQRGLTSAQTAAAIPPNHIEVPIQDSDGTFTVPVTINGAISLRFMIDSGATDVSIPSDVASTLIRSGTIESSDFIGTQTFMLADGSTAPSTEFRIRSLTVGALTLNNVTASLADAKAPLLLGQSFLKRLSGWSVDNDKGVLVLTVGPALSQTSESTSTGETSPLEKRNGVASDQADSDEGRAALARTMEYFATLSTAMEPRLLSQFYAQSVNYFGRAESRDDVLKAKAAFGERWPVRSYIPRPSGNRVVCDSMGQCTVTGLVDWQASNTQTGASSSGTASYRYTYAHGLMVAETSRVLSRGIPHDDNR